MSSSTRGRNNGAVAGVQSIPAASRKMVQSLKEIVNCPESEIYVALKDCNMDPNEAVNRLLSQDPFHEVKSKREKKKENKDTTESRPRGASSTSTRGARTGSYGGRGGSTQFSSTGDYGNLHGKPAQKKENGTNPYTNYSYPASSAVTGSTTSWQPPPSESYTSENKLPAIPVADVIQSAPYQSAWAGVPPGQISMADIVKKGRPQSKAPPSTHHHLHALPHSGSNSEWPSEDYSSKVDDWPTMPAPPISVSSVINTRSDSELHSDASNLPIADSITYNQQQQQQQQQQSELQQNYDDADEPEDEEDEDDGEIEDHTNISSRNIQEEISGAGSSIYETDMYQNMGSYQPQNDVYEQEAEDVGASVSSAAGNLQELSILDEEARESEDEGAGAGAPSLVIPNHLQVEAADCSHLSFGSFGSAAPFSTSRQPAVRASNIEEQPAIPDSSSVAHLDNRNAEYYAEDSLRIQSEGNMVHRTGGSNAGNYDSPPAPSQPEMLKQENADLAQQHRNQYMFQSSTSGGGAGGGYAFENSQDLNASLNNSQMQNLAPFSDQQAYTEAVANAMLASANSNLDIPYSPFPVSQSMSTKYGTSVSSISGSTISVAEALKTAGYSSTQQPTPQQTLAGTNVATGPALPQHLVNPYSHPLAPFTNVISYPYMPQSYTYMPSGFQQAFAAAGNNSYHQSLAAAGVLPQYKNSVSVSSLPQSAAVPSGYGAFGSSTTIPTNYPMNPPAGPAGATMSYEDLLSSQYKDTNHLISLQQGENPAMWLHGGPGSRTMSALQANHPYYSYQGQSHQQPPAGFRQAQQQQQQQQQQQPSQNYGGGALGYPNFYHSQSGVPLEHHQQQQQQQQAQNPRDGSHSGQPKPSQQIWQNSY